MRPLDRETLARLGTATPDKRGSPAESAEPQAASGSGATGDTERGTNAALDLQPEATRAAVLRLARAATAADAKRLFWGPQDEMSLRDRVRLEVGIRVGQCMEAVVWLTGMRRGRDLAWQISAVAMQVGDRATARDYLCQAFRDAEDEDRRETFCMTLAWVEDDPDVAAALLQRSCARGTRYCLYQAMCLGIVTHSDELADHYFRRWSETVGTTDTADWLAGRARVGISSPDVEASYPEFEAWK